MNTEPSQQKTSKGLLLPEIHNDIPLKKIINIKAWQRISISYKVNSGYPRKAKNSQESSLGFQINLVLPKLSSEK